MTPEIKHYIAEYDLFIVFTEDESLRERRIRAKAFKIRLDNRESFIPKAQKVKIKIESELILDVKGEPNERT